MPARRRDVRWTRAAESDLLGIISRIAQDRPVAAAEILARIRRKAESLPEFSERGRVVPELGRLGTKEYRELILAPWRILYRIRSRQVEIMAVLDSRRNVEDLLLQRLTRSR
jgi:plasmid stabilization system protein ParE